MTVASAVASRSAASIPFGPLAPLLPTEHVLLDTPAGANRRAARAIRDLGGGAPVLLVVDDAHTLDDASAALVRELVLEGAVWVVLTVRDGEPLPAAVHDLVASEAMPVEVRLEPLGERDVAELIDAVLEGPVDGAVAHQVWSRAAGNPLYVRELLLGALDAGDLHLDDGLWRWRPGTAATPALAGLVADRIAGLPEAEGRVLDALAVASSLGRPDAEELAGERAVQDLLDLGFVVARADGRRRSLQLSHPVYEEVLRATMTRARRREISRRVGEQRTDRGARRRGDHLQAVSLLLDAGGPVSGALLEAAARESYLAYDLSLTERVARAALDGGSGPALARVLGEILRWQGRHAEAVALLAGIDLAEVEHEADAALAAIVHAECLYRGLGRRADAEAVLQSAEEVVRDAVWRAELRGARGEIAALSGDVDVALALAVPVLEDDPGARPYVVAAGAAAPAMLAAGRADDAAAVAERAFSTALGLGPQPAIAHPALQAIVQSLALSEAGRLQEAHDVARTGYEWSLPSGFPIGQAWFALALGRATLLAGELARAERLFRESAAAFRDVGEPGRRRWALAGLAQAAAWQGRVDAAEAALAAIGDTGPVDLLDVEVARGIAAAAWLRGERSRAADVLRDAAAACRSHGQHGFELAALHDLVRLGEPRLVPDRIHELTSVQGPLAAARRAHAAALADADPSALEAVSAELEAIGARQLAAEAAAHAAGLAARRGSGGARRLRARAEELASSCGAVLAPRTGGAGDVVTGREAEVAALAAGGLTNAEIGERLGISARTVGNHLQRAYAKVGVRDRAGLAAALAGTPDVAPGPSPQRGPPGQDGAPIHHQDNPRR